MKDGPYKKAPPTPKWIKDGISAASAKRERDEIALRFAVAAYGGYWSNVDITSEPETIVDASFRMADAFLAARDGAS